MDSLPLAQYPGGDLVEAGLNDLSLGIRSECALLVLVAAPRLRGLGIEVPKLEPKAQPFEHELYHAINGRNPEGAHAEYNALIARVVSFANAWSGRSDDPVKNT